MYFRCLLGTILMLCISFTVFSQRFAVEFQQCHGGSDADGGNQIFLLADSTFIISGWTTSNDGAVSGNHGQMDFWLINVDQNGNILWQKPYGGGDNEGIVDMAITSDGEYILFGDTWSNNGDVSGNHGSLDLWVTKVDNSGNLLWQRCLGSSVLDFALQMKLDNDDNIFVIGHSHGTDGDITDPHGMSDMWIVKLDQNGNLIWEKSLGGSYIDYGTSILPTSDGGCLAGGLTTSTDGDVTCTTPVIDKSELWLVKLDSLNNIEWDRCYGGSESETVNDMIRTEDKGYLIAGATTSEDGDVSGFHGIPGESYDIWMLKIDSIGNLEWQKCLGGTNSEFDARITYHKDGEYYINCSTKSDDGNVSGNHAEDKQDIWLTKINLEGELLWQQCFGSTSGEAAGGFCILNDLELMYTSTTRTADGDVDCDLYPSAYPYKPDLWMFRIIDTVSVKINEYYTDQRKIRIYPNPADNEVFIDISEFSSEKNASILIYNMLGQLQFMKSISIYNQMVNIKTANFIPGIYNVVLLSQKAILSNQRLIIK